MCEVHNSIPKVLIILSVYFGLTVMRAEHWLSVQYDFTSMVTIAQYIAQLPILPLHDTIICVIEIIV